MIYGDSSSYEESAKEWTAKGSTTMKAKANL